MRLALIHSPFVGPSTWRRTAQALQASGVDARAVDYGGVGAPDWYVGAARRIAADLAGEDNVLVAVHSGAGALVPAVANELGARLLGFVLVDAVLPHPGSCWAETAPAPLVDRLRERAEGDLLPPWDAWFGRAAMETLIEDPALRDAFRADLPRVPLAYLDALAPPLESWRARPAAYLQLSDGYEKEADEARALGWRVQRETLHHLAMLTHPDRVAAILRDMACELATA